MDKTIEMKYLSEISNTYNNRTEISNICEVPSFLIKCHHIMALLKEKLAFTVIIFVNSFFVCPSILKPMLSLPFTLLLPYQLFTSSTRVHTHEKS